MSDEEKTSEIEQHIKALELKVREIAVRSGRDPKEISTIFVTKTVEPNRIQTAWKYGAREFGENRVQELLDKKPVLPAELKWHFIGHLQTNKVKQVLDKVCLIQSLDRPELLHELEKQAARMGIQQVNCLIQINCSEEPTKFGFKFDEVESFIAKMKEDSPVKIMGLMTIGPNTTDESKIRASFKQMKLMQDKLKTTYPQHSWKTLSMGMSQDYPIAIEEGSTMIRVGSAVFGAREMKR